MLTDKEEPKTGSGESSTQAEEKQKEEAVSEEPAEEKRKEPVGTKRKAEVLSKESGKIGVTITTSSPPLKVAKLASPGPLSPTPVSAVEVH